MKKHFLSAIAVLAFSTSTFANNATTIGKVSEAKIVKIETANETLKTCTITVKGTIDGKKIDIKVTVEADDCVDAAIEILKGVMK
jgi:hypothetical protein